MRSLVALLVLISACATLPKQRAPRGLYRDLRQVVEFRESNDWVADGLEVDAAVEEVMRSVCSTPRERSEDLRGWLQHEIATRGGPSETLFRTRGEDDGDIRAIRKLERVALLLDAAEAHRGECPYWLEQDERFAGVQGDEGRLVVWLESAGGGTLVLGDESPQLGGGGGGRLMPAFGITKRATLAIGFGLGGNGTLPENEEGAREFQAVFSSEVPVVLRVMDVSRVFDFEVAMTTRYRNEERTRGARVGFGFGLSTPRVVSLMPYAVLWVGYEVIPPQNGEELRHALWLGTRVGFDWDP